MMTGPGWSLPMGNSPLPCLTRPIGVITAAVRRTPVLLDGLAVSAAAMVAEELAPGARDWWVAGHRSAEPAHEMVLNHLQLTPILDLGMRLGEASGALVALPLLQMAAHLLAGMATFEDAGVSTSL